MYKNNILNLLSIKIHILNFDIITIQIVFIEEKIPLLHDLYHSLSKYFSFNYFMKN